MSRSKVETEEAELRRKMAFRRGLIKEIVTFVYDLVEKLGKETERYQGHSHTKVKRHLKLGALAFYTETGQTMMGGNEIKIFFGGVLAFEFHHQSSNPDLKDDKDWKLTAFAEGSGWLTPLRRIMKNGVEKTRAQLTRQAATAERARVREVEKEERLNQLRKKAARLLIT